MKVIKKDNSAVDICVKMLLEEKVIILPTDTVYGFSGIIVKTEDKIRTIKGRGEDKPFIVLIGNPSDIYSITGISIPESLFSLWPGPLTIIVPEKNTQKTVAVRCPGDQWLRSIINKCGVPIYSTSVNRSGLPVLGNIDDIIDEFEDDVDLIVDDGNSTSLTASTIISLDQKGFSIIRQGSLIIPEEVLKQLSLCRCE